MLVLLSLLACKGPEDTGVAELPCAQRPCLAVRASQKQDILARLEAEPWASVYARVVERADREWRESSDAGWDHSAVGQDATTAQAAAFLAWLHGDEAYGDKARDFLLDLPTDVETTPVWDVNIRMPNPVVGTANAWDLLLGADMLTEEESAAIQHTIAAFSGFTYERYVLDDGYRMTTLYPAQNNHPIRTAVAIGYGALALPDHPDAQDWGDFAASELEYLWGPTGRYVQEDGGVSEGPFYYGFALAPTIAWYLAAEGALATDHVFHADCINRSDREPWTGHGCVDGQEFQLTDYLADGTLARTVAWWGAISLPTGVCPPLGDAYMNPLNGQAIVGDLAGDPTPRWLWEEARDRPLETGHGLDLGIQHLAWLDPEAAPAPPEILHQVLPAAGNAVFRSSWGHEALWALLVAESGPARLTLHDHADGRSFSMAAFGEYLIVDPGYYKPNELDNAVTSHPWAHNIVLVDGQGCEDKGLLTDFGDADAFIENGVIGEAVQWAEAHQECSDTRFERALAMVRGEYLVVLDRLETERTDAREHRFRLSGYAGYAQGGRFELRADGATWERELAGVEVYLSSTEAGLSVEEPPYEPLEPPHVDLLDLDREVREHGVMDGVVTGVAPRFAAVLAPYPVGGQAPVVEAVDAGAGVAAWTVSTDGGLDLVLVREGSAPLDLEVAGHSVHTDAQALLVALEGGSFGLISRGTTVQVDGQTRAQGSEAVVLQE